MTNRLRMVWVITEREVRDQLRDWRIIFPIIGITVLFPFVMNFMAEQMLDFVREYGATIIGERLVPFLLMIVGFFPISVSLVIALETFVGERERGTIEPLLNSPLADWQLYLGKLLAATVPPLFSSYVGMFVYLAGLMLKNIPLPEAGMLLQIFCLTTVQAVMMVSGAVVVSSQATSVRAANLLASFIIIPSAFLIQGEAVMMFWGTNSTLWWAVIGLVVLSVLLVRVGLAHFRREELLGREIDVLNVRWMWQLFVQEFTGGARSFQEWYLQILPATLRDLRTSFVLVTVLSVIAALLGARQLSQFFIPLQSVEGADVQQRIDGLLSASGAFSSAPLLAIVWQNMRVLVLSMVLGVFSFGIIGVLPLLLTTGLSGYLFALLAANGYPASFFLGLTVPHAVFEIPAALLATAAVLRTGVQMATPTTRQTVGEVWITTLALWSRVMAGLVIPLLIIAAGIEAWVTPRILYFWIH